MTVAALIALAFAAVVPIALQRSRLPHWVPTTVGSIALAVAGWCAVTAPTTHGIAAGLSAALAVAAATFGGRPVARSAFQISRRRRRRTAASTDLAEGPTPPATVAQSRSWRMTSTTSCCSRSGTRVTPVSERASAPGTHGHYVEQVGHATARGTMT